MPDHRYPKQCYIMLCSLSNAGKFTWATHVRTLLYKYGFGYVCGANTVGNINEPPHDKTNKIACAPSEDLCTQRRLGSAWASAQSDQRLRCALNG